MAEKEEFTTESKNVTTEKTNLTTDYKVSTTKRKNPRSETSIAPNQSTNVARGRGAIRSFLDPVLFTKSNSNQRQLSSWALRAYGEHLKWRRSNESVLDFGCGTGNFTKEGLKPALPEGTQITALEFSEQLINYARINSYDPTIEYVSAEDHSNWADTFPEGTKFEKIFSFIYLMYIQDPRDFLTQAKSLLHDKRGQVFVMFPVKFSGFEAYREMARKPKWKAIMSDLEEFLTPYHFSSDPEKDITEDFTAAGITLTVCDVHSKDVLLPNSIAMRVALMGMNPWLHRVPVADREAYMEDLISCMIPILRERQGAYVATLSVAVVVGQVTSKLTIRARVAKWINKLLPRSGAKSEESEANQVRAE